MTSPLAQPPPATRRARINTLQIEDQPVHGWYRFVLSFPPHLVRQCLERFQLPDGATLLDPFCGTGTTLVEAKKHRVSSIGCDAHPFAALVSRVKTNWRVGLPRLRALFSDILQSAAAASEGRGVESVSWQGENARQIESDGDTLTEDEWKLLPTGFLSARPLRRLLLLRRAIEDATKEAAVEEREFFLLGLGHVIANGAGNFAFGPEIYRTKAKDDYDVIGHFARHVSSMLTDVATVARRGLAEVPSTVHEDDARTLSNVSESIAAVITSPPYPNEKDYTRTTRVESLILGLMSDRRALREVKDSLLRSNTRNVFVDDRDGDEVQEFESIHRVCDQIEARRVALKKTSGFERLYHKVVSHYFGGMRRHFRALRGKLRPGAPLAYVVGDQLSFLMVPVPTARLLAEVAESEGYEVTGCELWRERVGTKIRNDVHGRDSVRVREEILLLRKT